MQTKKKNKRYIIFLIGGILIILLCYLLFPGKKNKTLFNSQFLINRLESKLQYYKGQSDNIDSAAFIISYKKGLQEIVNIKSEIISIGERTSYIKSENSIEFFVISKEGNKNYIAIFNVNSKGVLRKASQTYNSSIFSIPDFCDSHYFYLQKDTSNIYSSFSLTTIKNDTYHDVRLYFSRDYDAFLNVQCPCDSTFRNKVVEFINFTFRKYVN